MKNLTIFIFLTSLIVITACSSEPDYVAKMINHIDYVGLNLTWEDLINSENLSVPILSPLKTPIKIDQNVKRVIKEINLPLDSRYCQEDADCEEGLYCITLCKDLSSSHIGSCKFTAAKEFPKLVKTLSENGVCFNETKNYN